MWRGAEPDGGGLRLQEERMNTGQPDREAEMAFQQFTLVRTFLSFYPSSPSVMPFL